MPAALLISPSFKLGLLILRLVASLAASVSLWEDYRSRPAPILYPHLAKFAVPLPLEPLLGTVVRLTQILFCLVVALALPLPDPAGEAALAGAAVSAPGAADRES